MKALVWTIVRSDDRYLLAQRAIEDSYGGSWCVPGGSIESPSGSPSGCAARELREEVGIIAQSMQELFAGILDDKQLHVFICDSWHGLPYPDNKEIIGLGWFTIPEIWGLDKSLSPLFAKILPQISFLIRHDHRYTGQKEELDG